MSRKRAAFSIARSSADPGNIDALIGSAYADTVDGANSFVTDPIGGLRGGRSEVDQSPVARSRTMRAAICCWDMSRFSQSALRRASPNVSMRWRWIEILPTAHSIIGLGKILIGHAEETEAHIAEALRLSPRDTMAYVWMTNAGSAKNHLGSYEQAVAWCRRAIEANRNYPSSKFCVGRRARTARSS